MVEHFILEQEEARKVYRDVEVASHGMHHKNEAKLTGEELIQEIEGNRKNLENLFERPVFGHIVPYGAGNEKVFAAMRGRDFCTGEKPPSRKSRGTFAFTSTPRA